MGAECSKLRQPMRAILALSRAQLLLIVVTRSRDLSRECHVTKHKPPARSNFPMFNFENSGTIQFSSSRSTSRGLCPKNFEKRAHPTLRNRQWCEGNFDCQQIWKWGKQLRVPVNLFFDSYGNAPVLPMQDILHVLKKLRNMLTLLDTRVLALGFDSNR